MAAIANFRDLDVYRMAPTRARMIFEMTRRFPREEIYSLTDQIRRSSRAVSALVAEAWGRRRYQAAFVNKISESMAEAMETQARLDHALDCGDIDPKKHSELDGRWQHIGAMPNRMIERAADFCKQPRP